MNYTEEQDAEIIRLCNNGKSYSEIGKVLDRTYGSVRKRIRLLREKGLIQDQQHASASQDAYMKIAALEAEVRRLNKAPQGGAPEVTCDDDLPDEDPRELWQQAERGCEKQIQKALTKSRFQARFDGNQPIGLTFCSDQHIAPGTPVALKRMREDAELIAQTPGLYAILGGDGTDNHCKHRAAIMASRSQPSDQLTLFEYYLSIFLEKICCVISGNHDAWTNQIAGEDPLARLSRNKKFHYSPFTARLDVKVGGTEYKIAIRHQYKMNSSYNQTHAVKQWQRFGEEDFDVGVVCHHHEPAMEDYIYRGRHCLAIRPGSYQLCSAYSLQYGYVVTIPTCPTVILWPGERHLLGVADVRQAAELLNLLRAGK